jgi:Protein of unknown function (DUF1631)
MTPTDPRLQAALSAALNQIKSTVATVVERATENLGTQASSAARISERDLLQATQLELRSNASGFLRVFGSELFDRIARDLQPTVDPRRKLGNADWQTLSLVDDDEVEERMYSDRIGQQISHACEVELRELSAYTAALLHTGRADQDRNPLRAESLGAALYRAIESVARESDMRRLLARELGAALARTMPDCYGRIVHDLKARGVQPVQLTVRTFDGPGSHLPGVNSAYATLQSVRSQSGEFDSASPGSDYHPAHGGQSAHGTERSPLGPRGGSGVGPTRHGATTSGASTRGGSATSPGGAGNRQADLQLMALLRRLTAIASRPGELDPVPRRLAVGPSSSGGATGHGGAGSYSRAGGGMAHGDADGSGADDQTGLMAVNLIRAHRDELMQASTGKLDHMVIDVVGSLFDQILSDTRVPPQMARQIARLQLPVLRVALNDSNFFSSRRHPVRRFVNRIASLACAFDDFESGAGKQFLERVRGLVQEIVEGDFDQIDLYAAKLAELEHFIAAQAGEAVEQQGAASTLNSKESELRLQLRYMQQLQAALAPLALPAYLREFLPQVWSQALVLAVSRDGADSDRAQRYRRVGRDLVMSVQPKGSPALRKKFLMQLPPLMRDLNEGLQLVGWPEAAQRDFFTQLLPAHAESLKGQPLSDLDHNMMVKQLETVFNAPVPGSDSLRAADNVPEVDAAVLTRRFSAEEAARVGLVAESAVDWDGTVDIELGTAADDAEAAAHGREAADTVPGAPAASLGIDVNLDLAGGDPAEPTRGAPLADHIKLGFAYQMHLKDRWQKVRLAHVSPARGFFVFTTVAKHEETISMTARMVARMCESGRMRAVESAYLMERATQRARKQLAALKAPARH